MAPTSRRRLGVAALVTLLGVAGIAPSATATAAFELERKAGADRYATASALAAEAFTTSNDAIIARGDGTAQQFADALAGSYLAGSVAGTAPLLLTQRSAVPAATRSRLTALGVKTVHILGGTGAVSAAVEQDLDDDFTVVRIQGTDRYDTAAKIAQSQPATGIGQVAGKRTAFLATGTDAADALAAGPASFARKLPILLTQRDTLPAVTKAALTQLGITHVVVLGGTAAVSTAVENEVKTTGATTERVQGINRYETASLLADFAQTKLAPWSNSAIDLANGLNPADALAGGPVSGKATRSILLTAPTALSKATSDWLTKSSPTLTSGRVFGGTVAVSESVLNAAEAAGKGGASASGGTVVNFDTAQNTYTYVANGVSTTVSYANTDTFTVDGGPATVGGFEGALSAADTITVTGTTTKTHALVNQAKPTSGTVGNVDLADNQLDIVDRTTGFTFNQNITYSTGTYTVDGSTKLLSEFEADLNEGDTIVITGTAFALTNASVSGPANAIEKDGALPTQNFTRLKIGGLGDDPETGSDGGTDGTGNDDKYVANRNTGATADKYTVDGAASTQEAFDNALTEGDQVTYTRKGGVETFALVNAAPTTQEGQAVGDITTDPDGIPLNGTGGGSFTLATASGSTTITYEAGGTYILNGATASEAEVEAAYSAGDEIKFRAADSGSGTTQRFELTNANLAGAVSKDSINTGDSANPPPGSEPANSYAVLARNGTTELDTVTYADGSNDTYTVNGVVVNLAAFEAELNAIDAGTKTGTVDIQMSGAVQQHRLTTAAA